MSLPLPEIGQRFGRLVVTEQVNDKAVKLQCECGNTILIEPKKRLSGMPRCCKPCNRKIYVAYVAETFTKDPLKPHYKWYGDPTRKI